MVKLTTLHEFIMDKQADFPYASGELSRLLSDIAIASKVVSKDVRRAGLMDDILGSHGSTNIQGEEQQNLDVIADNAFINIFKAGGEVCGIASEENDDLGTAPLNQIQAVRDAECSRAVRLCLL